MWLAPQVAQPQQARAGGSLSSLYWVRGKTSPMRFTVACRLPSVVHGQEESDVRAQSSTQVDNPTFVLDMQHRALWESAELAAEHIALGALPGERLAARLEVDQVLLDFPLAAARFLHHPAQLLVFVQ